VVLTRAVAVIAMVWATAACASAPLSPSPPVETTVVARWMADDGSVVALNVVLGRDADRGGIPKLARSFRAQHPGARVIVTFFADTAGPERYVIGHVPLRADGGPLPAGTRPASTLVTFDFPASPPPTDDGGRIDRPQPGIGGLDLERRARE
jgi:hypothetical protein